MSPPPKPPKRSNSTPRSRPARRRTAASGGRAGGRPVIVVATIPRSHPSHGNVELILRPGRGRPVRRAVGHAKHPTNARAAGAARRQQAKPKSHSASQNGPGPQSAALDKPQASWFSSSPVNVMSALFSTSLDDDPYYGNDKKPQQTVPEDATTDASESKPQEVADDCETEGNKNETPSVHDDCNTEGSENETPARALDHQDAKEEEDASPGLLLWATSDVSALLMRFVGGGTRATTPMPCLSAGTFSKRLPGKPTNMKNYALKTLVDPKHVFYEARLGSTFTNMKYLVIPKYVHEAQLRWAFGNMKTLIARKFVHKAEPRWTFTNMKALVSPQDVHEAKLGCAFTNTEELVDPKYVSETGSGWTFTSMKALVDPNYFHEEGPGWALANIDALVDPSYVHKDGPGWAYTSMEDGQLWMWILLSSFDAMTTISEMNLFSLLRDDGRKDGNKNKPQTNNLIQDANEEDEFSGWFRLDVSATLMEFVVGGTQLTTPTSETSSMMSLLSAVAYFTIPRSPKTDTMNHSGEAEVDPEDAMPGCSTSHEPEEDHANKDANLASHEPEENHANKDANSAAHEPEKDHGNDDAQGASNEDQEENKMEYLVLICGGPTIKMIAFDNDTYSLMAESTERTLNSSSNNSLGSISSHGSNAWTPSPPVLCACHVSDQESAIEDLISDQKSENDEVSSIDSNETNVNYETATTITTNCETSTIVTTLTDCDDAVTTLTDVDDVVNTLTDGDDVVTALADVDDLVTTLTDGDDEGFEDDDEEEKDKMLESMCHVSGLYPLFLPLINEEQEDDTQSYSSIAEVPSFVPPRKRTLDSKIPSLMLSQDSDDISCSSDKLKMEELVHDTQEEQNQNQIKYHQDILWWVPLEATKADLESISSDDNEVPNIVPTPERNERGCCSDETCTPATDAHSQQDAECSCNIDAGDALDEGPIQCNQEEELVAEEEHKEQHDFEVPATIFLYPDSVLMSKSCPLPKQGENQDCPSLSTAASTRHSSPTTKVVLDFYLDTVEKFVGYSMKSPDTTTTICTTVDGDEVVYQDDET